MKRFKFRLEVLLKIRIQAERQKQIALSAAMKELGRQQLLLADLIECHKVALDDFSSQDKQFTIEELQVYSRHIESLKTRIAGQHEVVTTCEGKRDVCLHEYEEAARKRKLIEKLKAKDLQAYQKELLEEEQKIIDEIAGNISSRKNLGD